MLLKFALLLSMLFQLAASIYAISLIRRTRYNISWILISVGFVLMAVRRLFDFSTLFWENKLFRREEVNNWIGVLISLFLLVGVIYIRKIFNLQKEMDKLREESEQKILSAVIKTEDTARQNFSRELHDGLGPVLSSVKMTLSAIDLESLTPSNKELIVRVSAATDNSIASLKEIANNLSPHILKNYGLAKAIETLANQLFIPLKIDFKVNFDCNPELLTDDLKSSLYRIVSELFTNSIKHASPSLVFLEITENKQLITVRYSDNGKGFAYSMEEKQGKSKGMGFNNIISRTKSLHGLYYVKTSPGNGFSVEFYFPKNEENFVIHR